MAHPVKAGEQGKGKGGERGIAMSHTPEVDTLPLSHQANYNNCKNTATL